MFQGLLLVARTVQRFRQTTKGAVFGTVRPIRLELRSITMVGVSSRVSSLISPLNALSAWPSILIWVLGSALGRFGYIHLVL